MCFCSASLQLEFVGRPVGIKAGVVFACRSDENPAEFVDSMRCCEGEDVNDCLSWMVMFLGSGIITFRYIPMLCDCFKIDVVLY